VEAPSLETVVTQRHAFGGRRWFFLCGFLLCVFGAIGFWFGLKQDGESSDPAPFPLVLHENDADFGEALMQEEFHWQLPIRNISSRPVEVIEFQSSCACSSINPKSLVVAPEAMATIDLVLDTSGGWKHGDVDSSRDFSIVVSPIIRGSRGRWVVKGRVRRPLAFSPPAVLYGETLLQGEALAEKTVLVRSPEDLDGLAVDCDSPGVRLESRPSDSLGAGWYELAVLPGKQQMPLGRFEIDVMVTGILRGDEKLPAVPLRLAGLVVADIYAIPDVIRFGQNPLRQESGINVVLQTRVEEEFEVEQVLTNGSSVVINPQRSGFARIHTFRVARTERSAADTAQPVSFVVRAKSGDRKHVDVSVESDDHD